MSQESWRNLIRTIAGRRENVVDWLILTPNDDSKLAREAETALARLGVKLPPVVLEVLARWNEVGSPLLVEIVPRALNPGITTDELNPTGRSMRELFPDFCKMIEATQQLAILVDRTGIKELLIAGLADQRTKPQYRWSWSVDGRRPWAYHLPWPASAMRQWEQQSRIRLSVQMRQLYLRMGGAGKVDPRLSGPRDFEKGVLFTEIYHELVDDLTLSPSTIERLQAFVVLHWHIGGDDIGFFADEERGDGEYTIYQWNHETVEFEPYADDFAGAVRDLVGYAVAGEE